MNFDFKLYEPMRERKPKNAEPTVEISPSGRIFFNKPALEFLAEKSYCKLGFDLENKAVGVLPIDDVEINSFPIRYTAKGAYIGAKSFFKYINGLPSQLINLSPIKSDNFIGLKL